ncbi:MAG TPA: hypothetical protein VHS99_02720, partial [Chloroflexota bacterium]|nr:hypothetical protein [Chloroflexota bacterium]
GTFVSLGLAALALAVGPGTLAAQEPPACAWPFEITPEGLGNFAWPDNNARYWMMPFDDQWGEMTITGSYPKARFMSFTIHYFLNSETNEVGDHLYDAQISPDPGGANPFVPPGGGDGTYTLIVTRGQTEADTNVLRVSADSAWVVYRVYLPDQGENSLGGVPLPTVTLNDRDGGTHPLEPCSRINDFDGLIQLVAQFFPPPVFPLGFELPATSPEPSTDRLWLAAVSNIPAWLAPNPDNKYVGILGVDLQPGRVVVIRGKAPGFPDTYAGSPIWEPAPGFDDVQLRYWSLCQNDLVLPFPTVQCVADLRTWLDEDGFYTFVISDDLFAPDWVPADVTWLPWGDELVPKAIVFRNMLPAAGFGQSAQSAIDAGCALALNLPDVPSEAEVEQAGRCTQDVMGDYYPVAGWCDEPVFIEGGWQACFAVAGIP